MIDFKRLRDIREDNDLSQREMADILGVKRGSYSLWELGINIIPLKNLGDFADYFNYSIDYVLGLTNKKDTNQLTKGINFSTLGHNLKEIRLINKLSQDDMAKLLGVTQPCIVRYEKGLIEISTSNLCKVAKLFKVSIDKLCKSEKIKQNSK